ncbi:UNKNOWN [Stylonychia lemnae]|uniref:Uncharacterized protein n=1 Tax=Stylonychia lemnae TaxID=5949 RepID=A0A078BE34_STYLE|nr:UNKNOWN [Stylonychia lemnae]|eukprot:CDW91833.1 UNKNOWN [Stylonychia lemnae]
MKEVGKEIKQYTELNGRTESNLIDTLNALYNYDMPKQKLRSHMQSKDQLSLMPYKQGYLEEYEFVMNNKVQSKSDAIQASVSDINPGVRSALSAAGTTNSALPDYVKKIKTMSSIPSHLLKELPSKLSFMADQTLAERESNPAYERMQRVQFKREIENSIQKVSEISKDQLGSQIPNQDQIMQQEIDKQGDSNQEEQLGLDKKQIEKVDANMEDESHQNELLQLQQQQQLQEQQEQERRQLKIEKQKKKKQKQSQQSQELWTFSAGTQASKNLDDLFKY